MQISETKTRTITLDVKDIKQAIVFYLKNRQENVNEENIEVYPESASAQIVVTNELTPKQQL